MVFWTEENTATAGADGTERRTLESRRLIFFLLSISICSQASSLGVFQINFTSLANDKGRDSDGRCCVGGGGGDGAPLEGTDHGGAAEAVCGGPCRTFFTVCLRHYQEVLPTTDVECTFGEATTEAAAVNSFNESSADRPNYTASIPFEFSWPNSFSLFVKAWHDTTGVGPSEGSDRALIANFSIRQYLTVSEGWRRGVYPPGRVRIDYAYRVVCSENFIGPGCSDKCTPRNDKHGHYTCSQNGSKLCLPGWTGEEYCLTAICLEGCNTTNGYCDEPFECKCRAGWKGTLCNECKPHPNCINGDCNDKHQCNCFDGWGGLHCNQDLNYCTNHQPCENGATCKNTGEGSYTCLCPRGFEGKNCTIETFDCLKNDCENGGVCEMSDGQGICRCKEGFSGSRCETSAGNCRDNPCKNLGTCHPLDADHPMNYKCQCQPGFTGLHCDVNVIGDNCASGPCVNGGRCINEGGGYRCVCAPGFTGPRCQEDDEGCIARPCANGATCLDRPGNNAFVCLCAPGFTGTNCEAETPDEELENSTTASDDYVTPETDVPTDSYLRQVMLVVCLGLLVMLLIVCLVVAGIVLHRRRRRSLRRRRNLPGNDSKQKMNNASAEDHCDGFDGGCYYEAEKTKGIGPGSGHLEALKSSQQHLRQHRSEFAVVRDQQMQRNINDANNLKNVEKCSNRKQKVLDWNACQEANAAKRSLDHDGPESKTNKDQTNEANALKQSNGTLSKRAPSNIISGSPVYFRPDPKTFNTNSIATEV